jgi:hypothetical protein
MPILKSQSYNNIAATLEQVANSWQANHPTYTVSFTSPSDLSTKSAALRAARQESSSKQSAKFQNTSRLIAVNEAIKKALSTLKNMIKVSYPNMKNYHNLYGQYGLVYHVPEPRVKKETTPNDNNIIDLATNAQKNTTKPKKVSGLYIIPADNDERSATLLDIIRKLSTPNDPLAPQANGLQKWLDLRDEHTEAWEESKELKSGRTVPVRKSKSLREEANALITRLRYDIKQDFNVPNIDSVYREFGFLKEVQ